MNHSELTVDQPHEKPDKGGIQSLSRAFTLLEVIANEPRGVGLTELSGVTGLHSSTVFHLLKTMVGLGYLRRGPKNKNYFIGSRLFCLAASARNELMLVMAADPVLRELALATGESCLFGIRAIDDLAIVVGKAEGNGVFQISDRLGGARPAHCTGMGKVLLAYLSAERLDLYLGTHELKAFTPNTITERARLEAELVEIRRSGLALDDAEFHADLRCIAAPVRDFTHQVIGALALSGPSWRLSMQSLQARAGVLKKAAEDLSTRLGHRGEQPSVAAEKQPLPRKGKRPGDERAGARSR